MRRFTINIETRTLFILLISVSLSLFTLESTFAVESGLFEFRKEFQGHKLGLLYSVEKNDESIWVGGENGVLRIRGDQVDYYDKLKNNKSIGEIWDIQTDPYNTVWLATFGQGVAYFNPNLDDVAGINQIPGVSKKNCDELELIWNNRILVLCENRAFVIDIETQILDPIATNKINHALNSNTVLGTSFNKGELWIIDGSNRFFRLDKEYQITDLSLLPSLNKVTDIFVLSDSKLVIGTEIGTLFGVRNGNNEWEISVSENIETGYVNKLVELDNGDLWILADNTHVVNQYFESLMHLKNYQQIFREIGNTGIYDLQTGKRGEVYIVANLVGLVSIPQFFENLTPLRFDSGAYVKNIDFVSKLADGFVVFSSNNKLYSTDITFSSVSFLKEEDKFINQMVVKEKGSVLASVSGVGLVEFNFDSSKPNEIFDRQKTIFSLNEGEVFGLTAAKNGKVYFGIAGGSKRGVYEYKFEDGISKILNDIHVDYIINTSADELYVATRFSGVMHRDSEGNWHNWQDEYGRRHLIKYCLVEDDRGVIWLCTNGSGLGYLDIKSGQIKYLDVKYTAGSSYIRELLIDADDFLWVMTNKGLVRYDSKSNHSIRIGSEEGIIDTDFEVSASINVNESLVLIAGDKYNYLIQTGTANLFLNSRINQPTETFFTNLNVFSRKSQNIQSRLSELRASLRRNSHLQLAHNDYLFTLDFTTNNYLDRNILGFEYRLLGLDDAWVQTTPQNASATFSTLPAGEYEFQVRVLDPKSLAEQPITGLHIRVLPPFWLTWQAYVAYLLVCVLLVWGFYKVRTYKLKLDNRNLELAVNEKTSELLQSRQFVSELLEQKHSLFANISHEFRTPLSLIFAPLEMLRRTTSDHQSLHQIGMIKRSANRLSVLVEQVLELAKLDSKVQYEYQKYSIEQAMSSTFEAFLPLAQSKNQSLELRSECKGVLHLTTDSFEKIVSNIVVNAIRYTQSGGTIELQTKQEKKNFVLYVSDNGPGISEDKQDKVFERFSREHTTEEVVGSGLGLAIAKELIMLNEGHVSIDSKEGKGTCLTVKFRLSDYEIKDPGVKSVRLTPFIQTENSVAESGLVSYQLEGNKTHLQEKQHVLIVEDNYDMLAFLSRSLSADYVCYQAKNGKEGFELAQKHVPDLIITDLMMPLVDGFQLAEKVREEETTSHIPLIMLTAKGDDESRKKSWVLDVDDFIAKPFELEELELRIARLLSIRDNLKKRYRNGLQSALGSNSKDVHLTFTHKRDLEFYRRFEKIIEQNFASESFNRKTAANLMAFSERQLNRKLAALIDHNFSDFLKKFRIEKAKQLLLDGNQITEVSYDVGFSSPSYFSKCFKEEVGMTAREFVESHLCNQV